MNEFKDFRIVRDIAILSVLPILVASFRCSVVLQRRGRHSGFHLRHPVCPHPAVVSSPGHAYKIIFHFLILSPLPLAVYGANNAVF